MIETLSSGWRCLGGRYGMDKEYREFATKKETYENAREEMSSRGFITGWSGWTKPVCFSGLTKKVM